MKPRLKLYGSVEMVAREAAGAELAERLVKAEQRLNTALDLIDYVYAHLQEAQSPCGDETSEECIDAAIERIQEVMEGKDSPNNT